MPRSEPSGDIPRRPVTAKQILELVRQQGYRCAISGRELTPETASIDHIVPLANGGAHDLSNVWIVHHQVNTAKGTLSMEQFVELCRDVATHQINQPNHGDRNDEDSGASERTLFDERNG